MPKAITRLSDPAKDLRRVLKRLLYDPDLFALLPGYGWLDGGCAVLGLALHSWYGRTGELTSLWSGPSIWTSGNMLQHIVYRLGPYYVDGSGVSTRDRLLARWRRDEHVRRPYLEPITPRELRRVAAVLNIDTNPALARRVAAALCPDLPDVLIVALANEYAQGGRL